MRQQNRRVLCHKGSQRLCERCVLLQKLRFLRRISRHTEDTEFRDPARPNTFCVFSDGLWPFSVFCGRFRPTTFTTMARIPSVADTDDTNLSIPLGEACRSIPLGEARRSGSICDGEAVSVEVWGSFPPSPLFYHRTHRNALRATQKEAGEKCASHMSAMFPPHNPNLMGLHHVMGLLYRNAPKRSPVF